MRTALRCENCLALPNEIPFVVTGRRSPAQPAGRKENDAITPDNVARRSMAAGPLLLMTEGTRGRIGWKRSRRMKRKYQPA